MGKFIFKGKATSFLLFFTFLSFLFLVGTISAQPPFQQEAGFDRGLTLRFPPSDVIKEGADITAHMHVYNSSDGLLLTNSSVDCFIDVYNASGYHIIEDEMGFDDNYVDFEYDIAGTNFTSGRYSFIIWCNSSWEGGFVSGAFEVTPTGLDPNVSFYIIVLILSLGIIVFGATRNDPIITLLGSFGLYFMGLYILFNGIVGVKDLVTTWAIGIIMLGLAMYISIKSAHSLITD